MSNPYQEAARTKKAIRLAVAIRAADGTAQSAELMNNGQWKMASQAAGVNPPSRETITEVIAQLRAMESYKKFEGDPFPEN